MGAKYTRGCTGWLIVLVVAALVAAAVFFSVKKKHHHRDVLPVPGPPGALDQRYADALGVALQFFQVQKCTLYNSIPLMIFCPILNSY